MDRRIEIVDGVKLIENIVTFQGEGPDAGKRMLLLRVKNCNRKCRWCDTKVKMRILQEGLYSLDSLQETIDREKCGVMITGGEPTFGPHIEDTIKILDKLDYPLANVETNGYNLRRLLSGSFISATEKPVKFIVSPKIYNENELDSERENLTSLLKHSNVFVKYVIGEDPFLGFLDFLVDRRFFSCDIRERVYLMPRGETRVEQLRNAPEVFELAEKYKMNFSGRQHIMYEFI